MKQVAAGTLWGCGSRAWLLWLLLSGLRVPGGVATGAARDLATVMAPPQQPPPPPLPPLPPQPQPPRRPQDQDTSNSKTLCGEDQECLSKTKTLTELDRQGLEAIVLLHRQLDDDENGNIDLSESDDFLREELQYDSGYERRQQAFHINDDMHISAKELWEAWLRSEVHNWTVEQTTEWLEKNVELPQYVKLFIEHRVTGATLPRMAVHNMQYLSGVLGIKDPIHKQKLALKAMDVVLFGPPKDGGHRWKDGVLAVLIVGVAFGCWWAYQQGRASKRQLHRMLKDMESLRRAEVALDDMQKELERARLEQENVATEKLNLEKKLQEAGNGNVSLTTSYSDLEVAQLKAEIDMLRSELQRAEGELEDRCWSPPAGLQMWLQLTHELENKAYLRKKQNADHQLQQAREACEKLKKKRSSLVGAFVSTHGKSIDDVDRSIVEARTALNEVTQELQERVHRWKQMELLCGFNIINNNGLQYLETALYRNSNGRTMRLKMSSSQDDLDLEDSSSLYSGTLSAAGAGLDTLGWKEDSSGSDELEQNDGILQGRHYPMDLRLAEARTQLEEKKMDEKKNQELRNQYIDLMLDYRNVNKFDSRLPSTLETPSPTQDSGYAGSQLDIKNSAQQNTSNGKAKDAIQFLLGGENCTLEDSLLLKQTRPATQSLRRPNSSQLAMLQRLPAPPSRRTLPPPGAIVKSHSTEAGLDGLGEDLGPIPRASNRAAGLIRQRTVASEVDTGSSGSEQSLTVTSNDKNINQTSTLDPLDPLVRRRKLRFPFPGKKVKVPTVNPS